MSPAGDSETPRLEDVELVESEVIAGRGRKQTYYLVRLNDAWVAARKHPNARVEPLDPGPGTVWERRVELELARGTLLARVESAPLPDPGSDPLAYLTGGANKARRRKRETLLRVGTRGRLVPEKAEGGGGPKAPRRGSG